MANCPSCGKATAAGATRCAGCGKPLSAPAPAASSDEIDLMPEEAPKPSAFQAYAEPPPVGPEGPPAPGKKKRDRAKEAIPVPAGPPVPEDPTVRKDNLKFGMIAAGVFLLLVILVSLKLCRVENKISGRTPFDQTFAVPPEKPRVENYDVTGSFSYSFEVSALDGDVLVGVAQRSPTDPATPAALKKLAEALTPVRKGETSPMTGELKSGKHSWIVIAEGKKSVRVKVKFSAK
jgi:hypothetical protein